MIMIRIKTVKEIIKYQSSAFRYIEGYPETPVSGITGIEYSTSDRQTRGQTHTQTDRQTDRQTHRHKDRQMDTQTHTHR
jgi:hypothetical protein